MIITKEGALASFYTVNKAPIKHLRVYFSPKQAGSGDPSPTNVREIEGWDGLNIIHSQKNLFDKNNLISNKYITDAGEILNSNNAYLSDYIPINGQCALQAQKFDSTGLRLILYDENKQFIRREVKTDGNNGAIQSIIINDSNVKYVRVNSWRQSNPVDTVKLELGQVITSYEPYHGQTHTLNWSNDIGTIYGGYVDLITGTITQTHKIIDAGSINWVYASNSTNRQAWYTEELDNIPVKSSSELGHCISTIFKTVSQDSTWYPYMISGGHINTPQRIYITFSQNAYSTTQQVQDAVVGVPIIYELKVPIVYQLTSYQMQTFIGQNNIWSNADRVEVEYELAESNDELYRRRNIILNSQPHLAVIQSENATNASNIAHFNTDIAGKINSLKINFSPIQEGSGDPSPDNVREIKGWDSIELTRCGKNLLKYTSTPYNSSGLSPIVEKNENNEVISVHWSGSTTDSNWFNNINYLPNKYNVFFGNFTLSTNHPSMPIVIVRNYSGGYRNNLSIEDVSEYTINFSKSLISSANTAAWYRLECWPRNTSTKTVDGKVYPMVRFPEDDGTFEPYNGQTITISLPSTIYGGQVDLISGKLIQTHTSIDLYNQTWTVRQANESSPYVFSCTLPFKIYSAPVTEQLCNIYPTQYISAWEYAVPGYFHIYTKENTSNFRVIYFAFNDINNLNDFQTWLINNSVQVVVKLDTPITYQLTPQTFNTLRGINNIWSNTNDNIEVSYWTH